MSLALWLRAGRAERGLSLDDVARVTKIQARILERLEGGKLEGLPAEVFVRGFIRSFAKCCGLDEAEALTRYTAAAAAHAQSPTGAPAMPSTLAPPAARAVVDAMAELAPQVARAVKATEPPPVAQPEVVFAAGSLEMPVAKPAQPVSSKKKRRGGKRAKKARDTLATGTPASPTPVVVAPAVEEEPVVEEPVVEAAPVTAVAEELAPVDHLDPLVVAEPEEDIVATDPWRPRFDKLPAATTASVPWRRPHAVTTSTAASVPSLVIDDSDPESAAQVLEDREAEKAVTTLAQRRSFLPPILLDREDRSARQGGLTLAVIILLIAATLTLSYLMRRPSSSGDGVTYAPVSETQQIG